jgi:hypothetical protein
VIFLDLLESLQLIILGFELLLELLHLGVHGRAPMKGVPSRVQQPFEFLPVNADEIL